MQSPSSSVARAALALFVVTLGFGIVVPILPAIAGGATGHAGAYAMVFLAHGGARIAGQIPGGVWVDRAGPTRVLVAALAAYAASLAALAAPLGTGWLVLARAVEGLATGLVYPAVLALASAGPADRMGRRIGLAVGAGSSGVLLGPVLGGALVGLGPAVPLVVGAAAAIAVLVWLVMAPAAAAPMRAPRTVGGELAELGRLAARPGLIGLLLPLAFNKLTFSGFQALLPLWAIERLGLGVRGVTALFAMTGVVFAAVQPLVGALADRVAPRRLIASGAAALLPVVALLGACRGAASFTALYAIYVLLTSAVFTATTREAGDRHGAAGAGGVFGLVGTATDLATLVGPALFLALHAGAPDLLFPVVALVGVPFAAGFAASSRIRRGRPPAG